MSRHILLLSFAMFMTTLVPTVSHADDTRIVIVLNKVVDHLNEYLRSPLDLSDVNVDWDWSVIAGQDIAEGCRVRSGNLLPVTDVFYDIQIYRFAEVYHFRVSMDELLMIRCESLPDVPDGVMPPVIDALQDLNRRLGMNFTHTSIPWTWSERQFKDYTLGCQPDADLDPRYDRRTNGYMITFTVQGDAWEYHVSADRLIVALCDELEG